MATLNIDGRSVTVDDSFLSLSPDQQNATVDEIHKSIGSAAAPISTAEDIAKTIPAAAERGVITGIGTPGDLANLLAKGSKTAGDYIAGKMGFEPSPPIGPPALPTSSEIQGIAGPTYQSQTAPGKILGSAVETVANPTSYLGPGGILTKGAAAAGAGLGSGLAGQATAGTAYEPVARLLAAIAGGSAGGVAAGARPGLSLMPQDAERAAQVASLRAAGIEPTAGQITGSEALRRTENVMPSIPLGPHGTNERVLDQLGTAALRTAGVDAPRATSEVMQNAADRLGAVYERVGSRNDMQLDPQLQNDLLSTVSHYTENVAPPHVPMVENTMNSAAALAGKQGGQLTGQQYLTIRSQLRAFARNATDSTTKDTLNDMASHFDDAMERSITNPEDQGALATANQQYRNLMVLERAASMGGEQGARGVITPETLASAVKSVQGRRAFVRGTGDLAELARNAQAVLSKTNSSGTAENANLLKIMSGEGLIGGLVGAEVPFTHALGGAAIGMLGPPAIGRAIMSGVGQRALARPLGVPPGIPAMINAIRGTQQ